MANIEMLGYTVLHLETSLFSNVQQYNGESAKHLQLNCRTMTSSDSDEGVLTFDVFIEACLPENHDTDDRKPIIQTTAKFMFSFTSNEGISEDELSEMMRTTGTQMAIPIIRGILAGVGNMLCHPDVYDFPSFRPEIINWEKAEE